MAILTESALGKEVTLTASTWTNILAANKDRVALELTNEDATIDAYVAYPFWDNPWALDFDGTDDVVAVNGLVAALAPYQTSSFKINFHIDTAAPAALMTLFSISDASAANSYLQLYVDTSGIVNARLINPTATQWTMIDSEALAINVQHTVFLYHDGVRPHLVIDGKRRATINAATDKTAWIGNLTGLDSANFGAHDVSASTTNFLNGTIYNANVYGGHPGIRNGMVGIAQYLFTEATGTSVADSIGSATGTISGAAAWEVEGPGEFLRHDSTKIISSEPSVHAAIWLFSTGAPTISYREVVE